jgi:hypothetical protein
MTEELAIRLPALPAAPLAHPKKPLALQRHRTGLPPLVAHPQLDCSPIAMTFESPSLTCWGLRPTSV